MRHDKKQALLDYFKRIENKTEEEKHLLRELEYEMEFYDITSVTRYDVSCCNYDGNKLSDCQMEELADKMDDAYVSDVYWTDIKVIADYLEFPVIGGAVEYEDV